MSLRSAFALPAILTLALSSASLFAADGAAALTPDQETRLQFHVMAGEMAAGRGQPHIAAEAFLEALKLQPDAQLASRATQLALSSGDGDLALGAARQWLELDPSTMDAREVIALLALRKGELEETYAQSLEIVRGHAGGPGDGARHVALLLSGEPGRGDAVRTIMDRLVAAYPELPGARYARALAALRYEDLALAERSAREALRLEPDSRDYKLLLVGVLVRSQQLKEADGIVDSLVRKGKDADELRMTYAKLLLDGGQREHARGQLQQALKDNANNDDARFALGVLAFNDGDLDGAEKLFKPLAGDKERAGDIEYQFGRIAEARQQYPEALAHYEKVTTGGQAIEAAVRRAAVLARMERLDEARASLSQLRRQFPPLGPRLTLAEAELLLDAKRYDEALLVYGTALEQDPTNDDLLYGRSLVHERMGRFPEAETDLRAILATDPDNARALNALGYMLTVNTTRYEEAHKLIASALERTPDDAAVIDSMGWVLFKLGKPEEARTWLVKALDKFPDGEIAAHLGEVLWALGEKDQALAVLNQALAREPGHRAVTETLERLTR